MSPSVAGASRPEGQSCLNPDASQAESQGDRVTVRLGAWMSRANVSVNDGKPELADGAVFSRPLAPTPGGASPGTSSIRGLTASCYSLSKNHSWALFSVSCRI